MGAVSMKERGEDSLGGFGGRKEKNAKIQILSKVWICPSSAF